MVARDTLLPGSNITVFGYLQAINQGYRANFQGDGRRASPPIAISCVE